MNERVSRAVRGRLEAQVLRCPTCEGPSSTLWTSGDVLQCGDCGAVYPVSDVGIAMMPSGDGGKAEIRAFWNDLQVALHGVDELESREELKALLADLEELFRARRHLAVVEMPLERLRGANVLEIGSGNGAHSALFASRFGARMTSIDITAARVAATAKKLDLLVPEGDHVCLQADAERLPFADGAFDLVYSNGVLHHTPNTAQAVREVHRVLRPGGTAAVMMYARHSVEYWLHLVLWRGLVRGGFLAGRKWLGQTTEWMARKPQTARNPVTKVYSGQEIRRLFGMFTDVRIRKNSFRWVMLPGIGPIVELLVPGRRFRSGHLVYGVSFRVETRLELWLGRCVGFGLNVSARK